MSAFASTTATFTHNGNQYYYTSLDKAAENGLGDISRLPRTLKILLENLLRHYDGDSVTDDDIYAFKTWLEQRRVDRDIAYRPARVLMQDFTGVPAIVDLAAMRDAMLELGGNPEKINPLRPVDLVIDHSVMVDAYAAASAFETNVKTEFERNRERYRFLRWGQEAFNNFRVVPPGTGICHQVNLEYLGQVVWTETTDDGKTWAYPDTLVGTDSHTTMIDGLAILGWGVGGIEAEAAMLGQPYSMKLPEVVGFKLTGALPEGATATDLVLTVTQMLREFGVVGKFVEFYGDGLKNLTLADRATIANMSPEYGATCGFFPIDNETLNYLQFTGRDPERIALVEDYTKRQGLWAGEGALEPVFSHYLELDLSQVTASLAGPKRPQDRVTLPNVPANYTETSGIETPRQQQVERENYQVSDGDVVIAAITSCTNTSNPAVMLGAGLLARNARQRGITTKPWVKTSLAPGSQVVTDYLEQAQLQEDLDALGFNLVGYGCTTCIGNSGPLYDPIAKAIDAQDLNVAAVLSGNRNFEGRIHPQVKSNYLASPMLVVAYALAGTVRADLYQEPLGYNEQGHPVYLHEIWPSQHDIQNSIRDAITPEMFQKRYKDVFAGDEEWNSFDVTGSLTYPWNPDSTYIQHPPYFDGMPTEKPGASGNIKGARVLALLGDSITTDHISPAGSIPEDMPAGQYLKAHGVPKENFNSFGSRRGNHEVMMRGTFGNIRLQNKMTSDKTGGWTRHIPSGEVLPIYDAAMRYIDEGTPLVVIAGKEYGAGSSRDWAAKGTRLLGVRAVIATSFERIHRANLVGMGVLPLQFTNGESAESLELTGTEQVNITGLDGEIAPQMTVQGQFSRDNGDVITTNLTLRIDTADELKYIEADGILHYVLYELLER